MLTQQEIRFLSQIKDHESLQSVSYLITALLTGTELHPTQIDQVLDHCNDLRSDSVSEGTPLPNFVEALWEIFTKLAMGGGKTPDILAQQANNDPYFQAPQSLPEKKKKKEPKHKNPDDQKPVRVKENPLVKYANTEIDAENIPPYLVEISQIIDKIVAAKCADVVKENAELKTQLAKIKALMGGI
jgi:hypothetical protein